MRRTGTWPLAAMTGLLVAWACVDEITSPVGNPAGAEPATSATAVTLVGAGDIARCGSWSSSVRTARLVDSIGGAVFLLGDNAYPDGAWREYNCYNASWGKFKSRTYPAPGNHEYHQPNASVYFDYFGRRAGPDRRGYYAYTLNGWRIYSLNSETDIATEAAWLRADLAAHPARCIAGYWHRPLFSSGLHPGSRHFKPLFQALYDAGAELVLTGHNHQYERFDLQDPNGRRTARGIREFVVGTGGAGTYLFQDFHAANSQIRLINHGVIKLSLFSNRYQWQFVDIDGRVLDRGGDLCH